MQYSDLTVYNGLKSKGKILKDDLKQNPNNDFKI